MDSDGSEECPGISSCYYGDERSISIKCGEFCDQLNAL
jgi:hypothetical protein